MDSFKECDLYPPVYSYFNSLGYDVKAEVKACDLMAVKDNETIIAELKTSFCLKLIYQAIERQSIADFVYVVIPRPKKGAKSKEWKSMLKLMKRLDIGIITVAMDSEIKTVDVVFAPAGQSKTKNTKKKAQVHHEFSTRNMNTNTGGINKTKILTAYREKCIHTLCLIQKCGFITPVRLKEYLGDPYADRILRNNYYGWFDKVEKGVYGMSSEGEKILRGEEYSPIIEFYNQKCSCIKQ